MTAVLVDNEMDTTIVEDFEFDLPPMCDGATAEGDDCPHKAEFKNHTACCAYVVLYCEDCFLYLREGVKYLLPYEHTCRFCGNVIVDPENHLIYDGRL